MEKISNYPLPNKVAQPLRGGRGLRHKEHDEQLKYNVESLKAENYDAIIKAFNSNIK